MVFVLISYRPHRLHLVPFSSLSLPSCFSLCSHLCQSPLSLFGFSRCSIPHGSSAKCTTVVFSTVDAARYICSSPLSIPRSATLPPSSHTRPAVPTAPYPVLFSSYTFIPSPWPCSLTSPPLQPSKGLNRPVQFPTRSVSNTRS